jgi:hypothetical protein
MAEKRKYSHKRLDRAVYSHQRIVFNSKPKCQRITANFTGITRNDTMDGKDYLVAPMVMIVEGVLPGTSGPLYYPASELAKTPQVWNMKPVVVDHPSHNGLGISACDPDIIKNRGVGLIMNTVFEDGKLKAEAWIDINKAEQIESRIVEAIENNEVMELSTGLFTDNENVEGVFGDKDYIAIARNYRPDHLALLPDTVGACSVADGAGFLRLNEAGETEIAITNLSKAAQEYVLNDKHNLVSRINQTVVDLIDNELSHSDQYGLLSSLLRETNEDFWIDEVFDSFIIYIDNGALYKQNYSINDGKASFIGTRESVTRKVVFETETGKVLNNLKRKDVQMKQLVDALIANTATSWTEDDREALMAMDEAVLNKMAPVVTEEAAAVEEAVTNTEVETLQAPAAKKVMTPAEYIADAPPEIAAVLNANMATYNAQKDALVLKITANKKNTFTKEQLDGKELAELQGIAALAVNEAPVVHTTQPAPMFNGQQEVVDNTPGEKVEPLEIAKMDFSPAGV